MPSSSSLPPSWYSQALPLQHDALRRLSLVLTPTGRQKRRCFLRAPESWAMVRRTAHQTDSVHSRRRGRLVWMRWESVGATCQTVGDVAASRRSVAS
ncbi:hypothetical protein BU14_0151s0025 [Porphyra umbilicalis]|uniref:Uncharacterized protein n=1 Tax=Porphyra umbilicalis TaxID=2786 RepID=A0A1X6P9T7_PORUM|nr:hypothetical protein BU14_0151s0025 [Porphyra umbilicalis]|eukprot:OSX77383.1 hypothetical protein BU14_0151s0025 [Porphyra umbilicalis]